jgi:hypothetical protein
MDGPGIESRWGARISATVQTFVFQFAIQNFKDEDIKNYNFARGPEWV